VTWYVQKQMRIGGYGDPFEMFCTCCRDGKCMEKPTMPALLTIDNQGEEGFEQPVLREGTPVLVAKQVNPLVEFEFVCWLLVFCCLLFVVFFCGVVMCILEMGVVVHVC